MKPKRPKKPANTAKIKGVKLDGTPKKTPAPPVENQWKPGQSGNPGGRPPDPPELKILKHLTKKELVEIGNLIIKGNLRELKALAQNPEATVITIMVAALAVRVIEKGDDGPFVTLMNYFIGKVKDEVHHTGDGLSYGPQIVVTLPSNGREKKD